MSSTSYRGEERASRAPPPCPTVPRLSGSLLLKNTLLGSPLQWQQSVIHRTKTTHVEEQATQNKPPLHSSLDWPPKLSDITQKACWWFEVCLLTQDANPFNLTSFSLLAAQFCIHCSKNNSHSHSENQMFLSVLVLAGMEFSQKRTGK